MVVVLNKKAMKVYYFDKAEKPRVSVSGLVCVDSFSNSF